MAALDALDDWPVSAAAAAVVGPSGVLASHGDAGQQFALASVTKLLVARAAQVAIEEGAVDLDTAAGPPGSTVRHLLAHASGLALQSDETLAKPGTRRIYSNYGFAVLAETVQQASGIEFARYLTEAVFDPLGMANSRLEGGAQAAGFGATSTLADLALFAVDLLHSGDGVGPDARRGNRGSVPRPQRGAAWIRPAAAQRLGAGLRDQGLQDTALDRHDELGAQLRPFRPIGHVDLGRSGHQPRARRAHRPRFRGLGAAVVAGLWPIW